jgi:hypothetical protein
MSDTIIKVVEGDKLYDINFTLKDANDTVVDITGATLLLKAQKEGASALKFSGSMTIVSGTDGTCKYNVADGDIDEAGRYYAEIEATFPSGSVQTFAGIVIDARPQLPR